MTRAVQTSIRLTFFYSPLHHPPTSSLKAMTDLLSQLRSLEAKRVALDQTVRQTQARVRSSNAHDERMAKRHAEEHPASGAPAVASSVTIANAAPDARRLSSPREKQVNAHRSAAQPRLYNFATANICSTPAAHMLSPVCFNSFLTAAKNRRSPSRPLWSSARKPARDQRSSSAISWGICKRLAPCLSPRLDAHYCLAPLTHAASLLYPLTGQDRSCSRAIQRKTPAGAPRSSVQRSMFFVYAYTYVHTKPSP
jgi:hypothetical protein